MSVKVENIRYQSDGILKWLDNYRDKWEDFYPSEKWAFEWIQNNSRYGRVLDVGCAMGGLGLTLSKRYKLEEYRGIDINPQVIERARQKIGSFSIPVRFDCEDVMKIKNLERGAFDNVFSLSCADWNVETDGIIQRCWECVKPGGNFIMSLRLTHLQGINDLARSHQCIAYDENKQCVESANYVVFNIKEFLQLTASLNPKPSLVTGYGYWGKPSLNAVTPYKELVFGVFIVQKAKEPQEENKIKTELFLPLNVLTQ